MSDYNASVKLALLPSKVRVFENKIYHMTDYSFKNLKPVLFFESHHSYIDL